MSEPEFQALKTRVGRVVQKKRIEQGFSQEALAEDAGLHRTYVGAIERGEINCSLKKLYQLAKVLGCEVAALVEVESDDDSTG